MVLPSVFQICTLADNVRTSCGSCCCCCSCCCGGGGGNCRDCCNCCSVSTITQLLSKSMSPRELESDIALPHSDDRCLFAVRPISAVIKCLHSYGGRPQNIFHPRVIKSLATQFEYYSYTYSLHAPPNVATATIATIFVAVSVATTTTISSVTMSVVVVLLPLTAVMMLW